MITFPRLCVFLGAALLSGMVAAQDQQAQPAPAPKLVPALGWDIAKQGGFVTSVTLDQQNNVWAGTEGNGLWCYDSRKKEWTQFTVKDGLGDDCIYALAVDKLGRVWAGHLNHGVSVWNGDKWKNYDVLDGPLGGRVFAIATCPTDGDVWIATDCGVARYSLANDDWDYFTRAAGCPPTRSRPSPSMRRGTFSSARNATASPWPTRRTNTRNGHRPRPAANAGRRRPGRAFHQPGQ